MPSAFLTRPDFYIQVVISEESDLNFIMNLLLRFLWNDRESPEFFTGRI
nr:hypothetical protein [uncultured Chryseobacterium sp.]